MNSKWDAEPAAAESDPVVGTSAKSTFHGIECRLKFGSDFERMLCCALIAFGCEPTTSSPQLVATDGTTYVQCKQILEFRRYVGHVPHVSSVLYIYPVSRVLRSGCRHSGRGRSAA